MVKRTNTALPTRARGAAATGAVAGDASSAGWLGSDSGSQPGAFRRLAEALMATGVAMGMRAVG